MRQAMIAMLLCACASFTSGRRFTTAEVEANYKEFYKEFTADHYDEAKAIVDQKKVDRRQVVKVVTTAMWQKVILTREVGVGQAKDISETFQLDRATEAAFARKVFNWLVRNNSCAIAADVVLHFGLGPAYADKAINCARDYSFIDLARIACQRPGTKALQDKLIAGWVKNFKQSSPDKREYYYMAVMADMCPLTADQYSDLFAIGLEDKQLELVESILEQDDFKKTPADYGNFIALAMAQYQCGKAATIALKYKLPDTTVEALFLNPKCFGGTLSEVWLGLVLPSKAGWFFDLSLRTQEFVLARRIIKTFSLGKNYFERVVREGLAAHCYDEVLGFEPWEGERGEDYRDGILNRILDAGEEWSVTRFVVEHSDLFGDRSLLFSEIHRNAWIERVFLRAFRRGAYDLAADIAHEHTRKDFSDWGIRLAFDAALQTKNADSANYIAKRWHLDKDALRRVALLYWEKKKEEAKKRAQELRQRNKRDCESSNNWSVKRCK